jgi:hypothetical protein
MEVAEEKKAVMGDIACIDTEFSMQDCKEGVSSIPGVAGVYGNNFGGPMDITDRPVVVLYKQIGTGRIKRRVKGTPLEDEIKAEVEKFFGCPSYDWLKPDKSYRLKDANKPMEKQRSLMQYPSD